MYWDIYRNGKHVGWIESNSLRDARERATRMGYTPKDGEVVLRDDKGYGEYRVQIQARPRGALGNFTMTVGGQVTADSVSDAFDKIMSAPVNRDLEFQNPIFVEFLGG